MFVRLKTAIRLFSLGIVTTLLNAPLIAQQQALQSLSPGRYDLLISVLDNRRATTATRRIEFQIE